MPAMARQITPRQQQVLDFIGRYMAREGFPPTLEEIGSALGIRSPNAIRNHLLALEKKGYLTKEGTKSRAIRLTNAGRTGRIARLFGHIRRRLSVERREIHLLQTYLGWCTKKRRRLLAGDVPPALDARLRQYAAERDWQVTQLHIEPDSVVIGVIAGAGQSARAVVRQFKRATAPVCRRQGHGLFDAPVWEKGFMATTDPAAVDQLMAELLEIQPREKPAESGAEHTAHSAPPAPSEPLPGEAIG